MAGRPPRSTASVVCLTGTAGEKLPNASGLSFSKGYPSAANLQATSIHSPHSLQAGAPGAAYLAQCWSRVAARSWQTALTTKNGEDTMKLNTNIKAGPTYKRIRILMRNRSEDTE